MIVFAGDPHGDFSHLIEFAKKTPNLALIILGDMQIDDPNVLEELSLYCDLHFIHGNHDNFNEESFHLFWKSKWKERNLHLKVKEIQGIRIAGLGGIFRGEIWQPPRKVRFFDHIHFCQHNPNRIFKGGVALRHRASIFPSDIEALEKLRADVLVSHEAPKPHPMGFQVLNDLAMLMGVKKYFHGHHHENFDYTDKNTGDIQIVNVGFRSLATLDGEYLLKNIDDRNLK